MTSMYQPPNKDLKSFSFCCTYRESFNIMSSNTKLFTQIAVFIIFPLSFIDLFGTPAFSSILFPDTNAARATTPPAAAANTNDNLSALSSPWASDAFLVYKLACAALNIALSMLSFSSLTYAAACIYTQHTNITFKSTICAFNKVWKKLLLTRLAQWAAVMGYILLTGLLLILPVRAFSSGSGRCQMIVSLAICIISLIFMGGLIYIGIVWIFGGTVAVLEGTYGFKALSKSRNLIKGKAFYTISVLAPISLFRFLLSWMLLKVVVNGAGVGIVIRIGCGIVALPLLAGLTSFAVVLETVTYLVCKADKGESITKSTVMEHLDIFVDGYALLTPKDEQL